MPLTRPVVLALAVSAVAIAAHTAPIAAQDGIPPGATPAPAVVETLAGEPADLAQWVGRTPVLVEFWATWCTICRALEPRIAAAHERFGEQVEFLVVAVAVGQDPASIARHLQRHPQPGRVLWDARGQAVRAFDAPGTGVVFVLDRSGRVTYVGAGAEQNLEAALAEVASAPEK